ncbi:MAG: hypothetical protein ACYDBJ_09750 [Aggregatilineales bacterium]
MTMNDEARLQELANLLASWKAGPSTPVAFNDLKDPHWIEKLKKEGLPRLYEQYGQMFPIIRELCSLYVKVNREQQAAVRETIGRSRDALHALNQFSPSLAKGERITYHEWKAGYEAYKTQDFDGWLRMLITVLALKLSRVDYRDDIMAIQQLAQEARQRGVDFEPYRQELIRLADSKSAQQVGLQKTNPA